MQTLKEGCQTDYPALVTLITTSLLDPTILLAASAPMRCWLALLLKLAQTQGSKQLVCSISFLGWGKPGVGVLKVRLLPWELLAARPDGVGLAV